MSGVEEKIRSVDEKFQDYLTDESRLQGRAEGIFFPESEADIREFAAWAHRNGAAATIQGGRTGLAGGAVPAGGCLLNLSKMCRVGKFFRDVGAYFLEVEPGLSLRQLRQEIKQLKSEAELFWPPDPTETSASVGGIVSCSARGLCAPRYGSTNRHVAGARDRQQLLLSLRNVVGFLVQDHVITIRQCPDKVIHLRSFRGSDDFLIRRIQFPVADVFHNGAVV